MDSIWFLVGCVGFAWLVLWSVRDFEKPAEWFWPFDARWMRPRAATKAIDEAAEAPGGRRAPQKPAAAWARKTPAPWRGRS